jgi:hypothetical protein
VHCALDVLHPLLNLGGVARWSLPIPWTRGCRRGALEQAILLDPSARSFGAVLSMRGLSVVGAR